MTKSFVNSFQKWLRFETCNLLLLNVLETDCMNCWWQTLKQTIERRKAALEQAAQVSISGDMTSENAAGARAFGQLAGGARIRAVDYPGLLANVGVIAGFTLFACIVKYVLRNTSVEWRSWWFLCHFFIQTIFCSVCAVDCSVMTGGGVWPNSMSPP